MSCLLEVDSLSYMVPGGPTLLEDISFKLHRKETLAIVGPSGSGKSTLLRCLNRLNEPSSGSLFLKGTDYEDIPVTQLRRRVGMVFQLPALFPGTVAENVSYGVRFTPEELDPERISRVLQAVGMEDQAEQQAATLSVGQAQRISLARALAAEPEILLLDEPTSALDRPSAMRVEELLQDLRRDLGLAWVMVTHDEPQGLRVGDVALRLIGGKVDALGPAREVLSQIPLASEVASSPTEPNYGGSAQ